MKSFYSLFFLILILVFSVNFYAEEPTIKEQEESTKKIKTKEEQLLGYENITNWLVENKDSFEEIIRENSKETKTKWFIDKSKDSDTPKDLEESTPVEATKATPQEDIVKETTYIVKKGDTLYALSKKYNVSQEDILKWNGLDSASDLKTGHKLTIMTKSALIEEEQSENEIASPAIPVEDGNVPSPEISQDSALSKDKVQIPSSVPAEGEIKMESLPEYKYYRVKKGDTFTSIARSHYMTKEDLYSLNSFDKDTNLSVDQIVKVKSNYGDSRNKVDQSSIVKDGFIWPVVGRLLIPFGTQEQGLVNEGINISAKKGTSVKATQDGVVIYVGNSLKNFGNLILIQHDNNWVSAYAHVDDIMVNKGQNMKKGDIIAKVSNTGEVNTSQLHFELRYNIKPMDPLNYLTSYR